MAVPRKYLSNSFATVLIIITIFGGVTSENDDKKQPHIVFLLADDLGFNDIGYSPYTDVETPRLNALANEALKLNFSYTPFVCTPSRAAILTGVYPFRYGLQQNAIETISPVGLDLKYELLPEKLRKAGYQTHMVGKWHLGFCNYDFTPLKRGFDTFRGFLGGAIDYYTHTNIEIGGLDYRDNDELLRNTEYSTYDFAKAAANKIKNNKDSKPMFLYLPLNAVHGPLNPTPKMQHCQPNCGAREVFKEMVKTVDEVAEIVVNALEEEGMWKDTVFIFSSDNGGQPKIGGNNFPLRGTKHTLAEGGTRVRTFVKGPNIPKGEVYNGLFHAVDWLPTILSAAGVDVKDLDIDGVDQWDALKENSRKLKDHPRKSFVYNYDQKLLPDGVVEDRSAVRLQFENDQNELKDFKMILGNPGAPFKTYDLSHQNVTYTPEDMIGPYFKDGALFDMTKNDGILEVRMIENPDQKVMQQMKDLLEEERGKGFQHSFNMSLTEPEALQKKDSHGNPIIAGGWC